MKGLLSREAAGRVAQAACLGYITTADYDGTFGRTWYVTERGLEYLKEEE